MNRNTEQELRDLVKKLTEELERISNAAVQFGAVVHIGAKRVVIAGGGSLVSIEKPPNLKLAVGQVVRLTGDTMQPVEEAELALVGVVQTITSHSDAGTLIGEGSKSMKVLVKPGLEITQGAKVLMDPSNTVVVAVVEAGESYAVPIDFEVKWNDIVGCEVAKVELQEIVDMSNATDKIAKAYGYAPPKGVLLYGPPGCGKTMLAKATATAFGAGGFISIKGPQILDPYVGVSEATVRELFAQAKAFHKRTGQRAILFIDEADAVLGDRNGRHNQMEKTIVPSFLAEMDGLSDSKAVVILATNSPDVLDPAITREGRVDRKIQITRPSRENAEALLKMRFEAKPKQVDEDALAKIGAGELFADDKPIYRATYEDGTNDIVYLRDIVSGSMVAAAAELAETNARRRDMKAKSLKGVCSADVVQAVQTIYKQNVDMNHEEILRSHVGAKTVKHLEKINAETI